MRQAVAARKAGWVDGGGTGINQAVYDSDPIGLEVTLNQMEVDAGHVPKSAGTLIEVLHSVGLTSEKTPFVTLRRRSIELS
jgi:hypothetical protein